MHLKRRNLSKCLFRIDAKFSHAYFIVARPNANFLHFETQKCRAVVDRARLSALGGINKFSVEIVYSQALCQCSQKLNESEKSKHAHEKKGKH